MRLRTLVLSVGTLGFILAFFGACSGDPVIEELDAGLADSGAQPNDAGTKTDAGNQPPTDAGNGGSDAGNGGGDAGNGGADAGEADAGESDAGETDAGTGEDDAGTGPTDAGILPGVKCGTVQCAEGEVCCIDTSGGGIKSSCETTCSGGGTALTCDGPEDCVGKGGFCCGALNAGAGSFPNCAIDSVTSACGAGCTTSIPFICNTTYTVRMCNLAADCANEPSGATLCCTFQQQFGEVKFCANSLVANLATGCEAP